MSVLLSRSPAKAGAQARTLWDADRQFRAGAWTPAFAGEQCVGFQETLA
jgi:hypothetical protein